MRRVGRPGLIGLAARTAVVTGTANAMQTRAMQKRQSMSPETQAPPPVTPVPPATTGGNDLASELAKLADMRTAGLLTDEEFSAAKARLLG